jgi:hypothetical protein
MDKTIILESSPTGGSSVISDYEPFSPTYSFPYTNEFMEVCDLTVDCNITNESSPIIGVVLTGFHSAIRRVKVIHAATAGTIEGFAITIGNGVPNSKSEGNIIEDCEVSDNIGFGPDVSMINLGGGGDPTGLGGGIVKNCRVYGRANDIGFGMWGAEGVLHENNYAENCGVAVYHDSYSAQNVTISQNFWKNCEYGFFANNNLITNGGIVYYPSQVNFAILNNTFDNNFDNTIGIWFGNTDSVLDHNTNNMIIGNTINIGCPESTNSFGIVVYQDNGLFIYNNEITGYPQHVLQISMDSDVKNRSVFNNTGPNGIVSAGGDGDQDGTVWVYEEENAMPNSFVKKTVRSNYQATYADYCIGVASVASHAYTISLPSANGFPGVQFIVHDEGGYASSSYPITVSPVTGQTINGASSASIRQQYGALTFISNGTNWFAR